MDSYISEYIEKIKSEKNIIVQAKYLAYLHKEKQIRTKDLARLLNMTQSYVCNLYRLNKLPEYIIDGYYAKIVTKSALFTLSRLNTAEEMLKAYEEVLKKNLTPNETEEIVREIKWSIENDGEKLTNKEKEEHIRKIKEKYKELTVKIIQTRMRGKIILTLKGGTKKTSEVMRRVLLSLEKEEKIHKDF